MRVAPVGSGGIQDRWRFLGDVRPAARANLASGASGAVTRVRVREGDQVREGELLVEVDPALAVARLRVAEAGRTRGEEALAQAKREQDRLATLDSHMVAAVELERARSQVDELTAQLASLEAALAEAKAQLALHRVQAPFTGVVAARQVDPGDWVRPGDPVLELVSVGDLEVLVEASSELFGRARRGDVATLVGAGRATAEIAGVVPALSPVSRTLRVRLVPKEEAPWLLAGASVQVEFQVELSGHGPKDVPGQGLVIPLDALLEAPGRAWVVRVVEGKAEHIDVDVLAKADTRALVGSTKLQPSDVVVVRGNERLRPGQPVEVVE